MLKIPTNEIVKNSKMPATNIEIEKKKNIQILIKYKSFENKWIKCCIYVICNISFKVLYTYKYKGKFILNRTNIHNLNENKISYCKEN